MLVLYWYSQKKNHVHIHSRVSVLVGGMDADCSEPDEDVIAALREALDARGLDSTGTFAQLEERLVDAVAVEQSPAAVEVVDVDALSITDLKELISKARMSFADCIDKPELRSRAREAAAALAKAESNYQSMFAQPTRTDDATELPSELLTAPEASSDKRALTEQLAALSLKELRGLIKEAGLSPDGCLDKTDLRAKALEALDRLKVPSVQDPLDPSRPLNGRVTLGVLHASAHHHALSPQVPSSLPLNGSNHPRTKLPLDFHTRLRVGRTRRPQLGPHAQERMDAPTSGRAHCHCRVPHGRQ
jgi:hypothetical protein